jgi:hypothetical protein
VSGDEFEVWFDKGVTDGLPVVPPTPERVERVLAGTQRDRDELVGLVPPNYGRATVEKIAVNTVMAGCRPDFLPVVLAAVEGGVRSDLQAHGLRHHHFAAPLIIVNLAPSDHGSAELELRGLRPGVSRQRPSAAPSGSS